MKRMTSRDNLAKEIVAVNSDMYRSGLCQGTSGNVSARFKDGMLITPSGIPCDALQTGDLVFVDQAGKSEGDYAPSSEWRFHLEIYNLREEAHAVVHTHSLYATTLAIQKMAIPAIHYMIAVSGGHTIRCADYATYGTSELSANILKALKNRHCCLMEHHGAVCLGPNPAKALWLAREVETLARQYILALGLGEPRILPKEEIKRVVAKFRHYGPKSELKTKNLAQA